jgi:hypothetical protein
MAVRIAALTTQCPLSAKVGSNFFNKQQSLGIIRSPTQAMEFVVFI